MPLSYGAKVSKTGYDVKTSTSVDTPFSSKFSTLKILMQGDTSFTTDGSGNGSVSISHDLGYAPAHYVFRKVTAGYAFLDASTYSNSFVPLTKVPSIWAGDNAVNGLSDFQAYTTSTALVIESGGASPNTTYNFRYYIFVDLAQDFSGSAGITLNKDYGLKVSKDGYDVKTAKEYQMAYSQKYKSLQYYDESYKTQDLTLPSFWASIVDTDVEAGTYVDFTHGLGYQPFYFAFAYDVPFTGASGYNVFTPYGVDYSNLATSQQGYINIDSFCDSTRVRVSFTERSITTGTNSGPVFNSSTITIKCFIFTENLTT
jgi:hypothetical protein